MVAVEIRPPRARIKIGPLPYDGLQSAFSLKIRLVLISSSAIANHDVIITYALVFRGFAARVLRFRVQYLCKEK